MVEKILIISSNIGSLFEDNLKIYQSWFEATKEHINNKNADFVIITFQEFGGKLVAPKQESDKFLLEIYNSFKQTYPKFLVTCDNDITNEEQHTALCTVFMSKTSFKTVEVYNFKDQKFLEIKEGCKIEYLSIHYQSSLKIKFTIDYFPYKKWSRKGYLINRLRLDKKQIFDIVNLHLIHDANFCTIVNQPQTFQNFRSRQLKNILNKLDDIKSEKTILCGDFNFRTSLMEVIKNYDPTCVIEQKKNHSSMESLIYIQENGVKKTLASMSEKDMQLSDSLMPLDDERLARHKRFDVELSKFDDELIELPITFMPTYCFLTDSKPLDYNYRRFPSWCDRIVFRGKILPNIKKNNLDMKYESYANSFIVGDHKPISIEFPMFILT